MINFIANIRLPDGAVRRVALISMSREDARREAELLADEVRRRFVLEPLKGEKVRLVDAPSVES